MSKDYERKHVGNSVNGISEDTVVDVHVQGAVVRVYINEDGNLVIGALKGPHGAHELELNAYFEVVGEVHNSCLQY